MNVICENRSCKYCGNGGFCRNDYVMLNAAGCCDIWWNKNVTPRQFPFYNDAEASPNAATDQAFSQQEKIEG